ncbi:MAG: hypothetical protein VKJ64_22310 [Leptolyngbyaceae bacterium]|nr:hypothetical protein [Leptolyngbyaceae bacterium]
MNIEWLDWRAIAPLKGSLNSIRTQFNKEREGDLSIGVVLGDRLEGCALEQFLETDPDLVGTLVHLCGRRYLRWLRNLER